MFCCGRACAASESASIFGNGGRVKTKAIRGSAIDGKSEGKGKGKPNGSGYPRNGNSLEDDRKWQDREWETSTRCAQTVDCSIEDAMLDSKERALISSESPTARKVMELTLRDMRKRLGRWSVKTPHEQ